MNKVEKIKQEIANYVKMLCIDEIDLAIADECWDKDFSKDELSECMENVSLSIECQVDCLSKLYKCVFQFIENELSMVDLMDILNKIFIKESQLIFYLNKIVKTSIVRSSSFKEKNLAILSASIYIQLLRMPSSKMYNIYSVSIYVSVIEFLKLLINIKSKKGKKKKKNEKKTIMHEISNVSNDEENEWAQLHNEEVLHLIILSNNLFKEIYLYTRCSAFDENISELTLKLFVEIIKVNNQTAFQSLDLPVSDNLHYIQIAYMVLYHFCQIYLNKNIEIVQDILISLIPLQSMSYYSAFQTINSDSKISQENSTVFIIYLIKCFYEDQNLMYLIELFLRNVCINVPDKSDYRTRAATGILQIIKSLPPKTANNIIIWITNSLAYREKASNRSFALELINHIILEHQALYENIGNSLIPINQLIYILVHGMRDEFFSVKIRAIQIIDTFITNRKNYEHFSNSCSSTGSADESSTSSTNSVSFLELKQRLQSCISEDNCYLKRSAIIALASAITIGDFMDLSDLKIISNCCFDSSIIIKKQSMQCITNVLLAKPDCKFIKSVWIESIMPIVLDEDDSAQKKCLEIVKKILIENIVSYTSYCTLGEESELMSTKMLNDLVWDLIGITIDSNDEIQSYFSIICKKLIKQNDITKDFFKILKSYLNTEFNEKVWYYISKICSFDLQLDEDILFNILKNKNIQDKFYNIIIEVLINYSNFISFNKSETINHLQNALWNFNIPINNLTIILNCIKMLSENHQLLKNNLKSWCEQFSKHCYNESHILLTDKNAEDFEDPLLKQMFTLGVLICLTGRTENLELLPFLQCLMAIKAPLMEEQPGPVIASTSYILSQNSASKVSSKLRQFAFITAGKMCLFDEQLTLTLIPIFVYELTSSDVMIRDACMSTLSDLILRFTLRVDPYVNNMSALLKDNDVNLRFKTVMLFSRLLKEDMIKWKEALFFRYIRNLVAANLNIQNLTKSILETCLKSKTEEMYLKHFLESILYFNACDFHPKNPNCFTTEKEGRFQLTGMTNLNKRAKIYRFMLANMNDMHKLRVIEKLFDMFDLYLKDMIPNKPVIHVVFLDIFICLTSSQIKLKSLNGANAADIDEVRNEEQMHIHIQNAGKKVALDILMRRNVSDYIVPTVVELKNKMSQQKSPVANYCLRYLSILLKDFKNEVQEALINEHTILTEIEYELKHGFNKNFDFFVSKQETKKMKINKVKKLEATSSSVFLTDTYSSIKKSISINENELKNNELIIPCKNPMIDDIVESKNFIDVDKNDVNLEKENNDNDQQPDTYTKIREKVSPFAKRIKINQDNMNMILNFRENSKKARISDNLPIFNQNSQQIDEQIPIIRKYIELDNNVNRSQNLHNNTDNSKDNQKSLTNVLTENDVTCSNLPRLESSPEIRPKINQNKKPKLKNFALIEKDSNLKQNLNPSNEKNKNEDIILDTIVNNCAPNHLRKKIILNKLRNHKLRSSSRFSKDSVLPNICTPNINKETNKHSPQIDKQMPIIGKYIELDSNINKSQNLHNNTDNSMDNIQKSQKSVSTNNDVTYTNLPPLESSPEIRPKIKSNQKPKLKNITLIEKDPNFEQNLSPANEQNKKEDLILDAIINDQNHAPNHMRQFFLSNESPKRKIRSSSRFSEECVLPNMSTPNINKRTNLVFGDLSVIRPQNKREHQT